MKGGGVSAGEGALGRKVTRVLSLSQGEAAVKEEEVHPLSQGVVGAAGGEGKGGDDPEAIDLLYCREADPRAGEGRDPLRERFPHPRGEAL